jgi:3-hydroxybutyryl-CoA dehydrogenase
MKTIGVLGVGAMGAGVVQVLALAGYEVLVRSRKQTSIDKGLAAVSKGLSKMIEKEKLTEPEKNAALARISSSTDLAIIQRADLIIEAAAEDMASKKALFADLDQLCKPETIFATNTSSLSISEIAAAAKRTDKVIGLHFFNPVPLMELVEIVKGVDTSEETSRTIFEFAEKIGKKPVMVEESPGFVVNRILVPMINEAVGILADGIAAAEDIDAAMKLGANHPMGPLALGDLIGLDICLAVMETFHEEFGDDKYRPHPLLRKMVRAGNLGRKTGRGFFNYAR